MCFFRYRVRSQENCRLKLFAKCLNLRKINKQASLENKEQLCSDCTHTGDTRTDNKRQDNTPTLLLELRQKKKRKRKEYKKLGPEKIREMSRLITILVVLKIIVWSWPSEFGEVLLVVELQEVGSLSAKTEKGRRQAARQGHEPLGAMDTQSGDREKKCVTTFS